MTNGIIIKAERETIVEMDRVQKVRRMARKLTCMSCQGFQDQGARKQFYDPDKRDTPKVVFSSTVVWTVVG
jgi:hypothetical protein